MGNAAKVQTALRLSEEDQTTIVTLKKEVEKAWKLVDASHEKVLLCMFNCCIQDAACCISDPNVLHCLMHMLPA